MRIILSLFILIFASLLWAVDDEPPGAPQADGEPPVPAAESAGSAEQAENKSDAGAQTENPQSRKPITYITPDKAKQRMAEALHHLKIFQREDEIIEINGSDHPFAGLYLPQNTGKPQGAVLILHDIGQHAHWPNTISPIREYLPDYGWSTLSVFFEQYLQKPLPKILPAPSLSNEEAPIPSDAALETDNSENTTASVSENPITDNTENPANTNEEPPLLDQAPASPPDADALDAIASTLETVPDFTPTMTPEVLSQPAIAIEDTFIEKMMLRVEDSLNQLNQLGQYNLVIIANGYSANWAARMLEKRLEANSSGYALILIDAKSSDYPDVSLNEHLIKLNIPILDIVTDSSAEAAHKIKARKSAMHRNQNKKYQQLFLPAIKPSLTQSNNIISRRIRGWLMTHAAGEELTVKKR